MSTPPTPPIAPGDSRTQYSVETIRRFPCFKDLDDQEASTAAGYLRSSRIPAGQELFTQGDRGDIVYLVVLGTLEIKLEVPGCVDRTLATLGEGSIFGEIGLLLDEPRTATAIAKTDAEFAHLDRATFHAALADCQSWAGKLLMATGQTLARRLASTNRELGGMISVASEQSSRPEPAKLAADLESLRARLFTEWSF